jgi:hypothetical protein
MNRNIIPQNEQNKPQVFSEVLQITALQRLKEALVREEYELCPALIRSAKKRGVDEAGIRSFLAGYVTGAKGEAGGKVRKRPRF